MPDSSKELLTGLLESVSRSFYRTLRVLPKPVRSQIGLAYLLARTTDTIADTELVPLERRLSSLRMLRARIAGAEEPPLDFGELARLQGSAAERLLLEKCDASLALLRDLSAPDQHQIRRVLDIITSGQELDLCRFARAGPERIVALQTDGELDDYTYRVAGCVGEFWTKLCRSHLFPKAPLDEASLLAQAVRFGKGLQLVNILRDLPSDLRRGRCYLPTERLETCGLTPEDLLKPDAEVRLRPVYDQYLDHAEAHLAAGWTYTNTLPRRQMRVRLACAWPILIGVKTLALLRTGRVLDPQQRLKISRREVRNIMMRSALLYPWPAAWRNLISFPPSAK